MIVLDAGVLIAAFSSTDKHHEWALKFLRDTAADELIVSALTFAEVLVAPARANIVDEFRRSIEPIGFRIDDLTPGDAVSLARVRSETGLKMPDAVVLNTALKHSCELATTDAALAQKAASRGIPVYSLPGEN